MSSPSGSATITSETKKDAHSAKKLFLAAPREYKRKLSKKGKDTQANGPQQDTKPESAGGKALKSDILSEKPVASDMAAENGAANGSHPGVSVGQDPDQAVPAATGHGNAAAKDSDGGHSAEQSASSTGGDRDTQKEKASLSTTVTGTGTTLKHKKDKTSETVNSGTIVEKPTSKQSVKKERASRKKKKSFWSKLASAVFNCTWPSDPPHAVDIDEGASGVSDPSSSAIGLKEISAPLRDKEGLVIEEAAPLTTSGPSNEPSGPTSTDAESPASPPNLTIPPIEDAAIVVPPSPTKHVPPEDMAGGLTSAAVQPPGSTGREAGEDSDESSFAEQDEDQKMDEEDEEERLIMNGGAGIPIGPDGVPRPLLPPIAPQHAGRKCLVLDLDETLLHSSFKVIFLDFNLCDGFNFCGPVSQYNMRITLFRWKSNIIGIMFTVSSDLGSITSSRKWARSMK